MNVSPAAPSAPLSAAAASGTGAMRSTNLSPAGSASRSSPGAWMPGVRIKSMATNAHAAPIQYVVTSCAPTALSTSGPNANPSDNAAVYTAIVVARERSLLIWFTHASDITNTPSDPTPSRKRSGNQSHSAVSAKPGSTSATSSSASVMPVRSPTRSAKPGSQQATTSTPMA